jgi:hypothetical protein
LAGSTWPSLTGWLGWDAATYYPYDYGENITYDGNNVYYGSQSAGTTQEYYQEAGKLANAGSAAPSSDAQWLPLGIFGLLRGDEKTPSVMFDLAVDKQGIIRGNALIEAYDITLPVHGSIQKRTQRVCWTVGNDKTTVYDTGLYSLTQREEPVLVHIGPKTTRQELLVRFKKPAEKSSANGSLSSAQ